VTAERLRPSWRDGATRSAVAEFLDSVDQVLDTAARFGWTVVSVKDDWSTVFASS